MFDNGKKNPSGPRILPSPVTQSEVEERDHNAIRTRDVLNEMGINPRGHWGFSEVTRSAYFCVKTLVRPDAGEGEICRMEVFQNQERSDFCFFIVYCRVKNPRTCRIDIRKQFFTNDPDYARRYGWSAPNLMGEIHTAAVSGTRQDSAETTNHTEGVFLEEQAVDTQQHIYERILSAFFVGS